MTPHIQDSPIATPSADEGSEAGLVTLSAGMDDRIDNDLHGIVGIGVIGGTPADAAVVNRQLGGLRAPLDREPDVVVSFIEPEAVASDMRYLDLDDAAFDGEHLLRSSDPGGHSPQEPHRLRRDRRRMPNRL